MLLVGIATGYWLDAEGSDFESRQEQNVSPPRRPD
jgi:hypothetical protein